MSVLTTVTVWLLWQRKQFQAGSVNAAQPKVFSGEVCQIDTGMDLINITPTAVTIVPGPHHVYPPEEVSTYTTSQLEKGTTSLPVPVVNVFM